MKRLTSRVAALMMSFCILSSASACSKKETGDTKQSQKKSQTTVSESDPFYNADEVRIRFPLADSDKKLIYQVIGEGNLLDNAVWFEYYCSYETPADLKAKYDRFCMNPDSFSEEETNKLFEEYGKYNFDGKIVYNLDGSIRCLLETRVGYYGATTLFTSNEGKLMAAVQHYNSSSAPVTLEEVSDTGEYINSIPLEGADTYFMQIRQLSNGNYICADGGSIWIFDPQGKKIAQESLGESIINIVVQDGRVYIPAWVYDMESGNSDPYVCEFDLNTYKFSKDMIPVSLDVNHISQGKDGIYTAGSSGISKIDLTARSSQEILNWKDADVNPNAITFTNIISENEMYVLRCTEKWDRHFNHCYEPDIRLVHLTKADKNPNAGKRLIELASVGGNPPSILMDKIVDYNKDPNKDGRIVIKEYNADSLLFPTKDDDDDALLAQTLDQAYLDLLSGGGPDIYVNFGSYSQFNDSNLMMDLNTLIDGENGIKRDEYFDNLFRACEINGKLLQIPVFFTANGAVANDKYLDGKTSWTYDDYMTLTGKLPGNLTAIPEMTRIKLLKELMASSGKELVDYDKKEVHFSDPDFRKMLEAAKALGSGRSENEIWGDMVEDQRQRGGEYLEEYKMLQNGMVMSYFSKMIDIVDYAQAQKLSDGKGVLIGNPGCDGGLSMEYIMSIAIPKNSSSQKEAWEFIRFLLEKDTQVEGAVQLFAFPVSRGAAEEYLNGDKKLYLDAMANTTDRNELEYLNSLPKIDDQTVKETMEMLGKIKTARSVDETVFLIVAEEAPAYFTGQKSLDDVVNSIQNRASTVVKERG